MTVTADPLTADASDWLDAIDGFEQGARAVRVGGAIVTRRAMAGILDAWAERQQAAPDDAVADLEFAAAAAAALGDDKAANACRRRLPEVRYLQTVRRYSEDAQGHEHGADGRFVAQGRGDSGRRARGDKRAARLAVRRREVRKATAERVRGEVQAARTATEGKPAQHAAVASLGAVYQAAAGVTTREDMRRVLDVKRVRASARESAAAELRKGANAAKEALAGDFTGRAGKAVAREIDRGAKDMASSLAFKVSDTVEYARRYLGKDDTRRDVLDSLKEGLDGLADPDMLRDAFGDSFGVDAESFAADFAEELRQADWPFRSDRLLADAPDVDTARQRLRDKTGVDLDPGGATDPYDYWDQAEVKVLGPMRERAAREVYPKVAAAFGAGTAAPAGG